MAWFLKTVSAARQMKQAMEKEKKSKKRILLKVLIILFTLLVVFRILLPYIVLKYVNKSLSKMKEYYGHVEDIDIHLIRGAYVINDMKIWKKVKKGNTDRFDTIPFFSARSIDLSVQWGALFKGRVVGEIYVEDAALKYVKGKHKGEDVKTDTADFRQLVDDLMPLTVNHFEIYDSRIHYIDPYASPAVDIYMNDIFVYGANLSNVNKKKEILPATIHGMGHMYGGNFALDMKLNPLARNPTFDMNARMDQLNLVQLNPFLQAYGNFDVKKGEFNMYTEFAAKEGGFGGYVKPLVKDLDIVQWNKTEGDFGQILWETLIGVSAEVLQNQKKDQLATKVPINGRFEDPETNVWSAVNYLLRNAFVHSLKPAIDNSINIYHLREDKKSWFERLFGSKKDKKERKEKKKKERRKNKRDEV
jgi:hypothetical protein